MVTRDLINNCTVKSLIPAQSRNAGNVSGDPVDLKGKGRKVLVILDAGKFGTNATLDVRIKECDTSTGTFTDVPNGTFSQKTAAGIWVLQITPTKRYIKAVATVGTAAVDFAVDAIIFLEREVPSGI